VEVVQVALAITVEQVVQVVAVLVVIFLLLW
jgi:hypothetical protein